MCFFVVQKEHIGFLSVIQDQMSHHKEEIMLGSTKNEQPHSVGQIVQNKTQKLKTVPKIRKV